MVQADQLRIYLFGPPRLIWQDQTFRIPRRQVQALLYRLAADQQPCSRDYLGYLFWPDQPQVVARRRLTHLQTHLSRSLPADDLLIISDDHMALNWERVLVDAVVLHQALAEGPVPELQSRW